jgi:hypothetical protein
MKLPFLVLSLGSLLASGCGEDNKPLTPAEFSNRYAQDMCKAVSAACLIPEASCTAGQLFTRATLDQAAVARGQAFVPSNAEACLGQVNSVYGKLQGGAVALKASDFQSVGQVCADVYRGSKRANETCGVDQDCVMGLICDRSKGLDNGRCGTKTEVSLGCANIGEVCARGSYCGNLGGVFACLPKIDLAAPCDEAVPCLESLRCAGGLCVAQLGIGAVCASDQDCATGFCEPFEKLCAADVRFARGTASCTKLAGP